MILRFLFLRLLLLVVYFVVCCECLCARCTCVLTVGVRVYVCVRACYMQFVYPRAREHCFLFLLIVVFCYFNFIFYFVVSCESVCVYARRACVLPVGMRGYVCEFVLYVLCCVPACARANFSLFLFYFCFLLL